MRYRVSYADTDRMGRVYYANYLVWFERARTEFLRAEGYPYRELEAQGIFLPVRRCEVLYHTFTEYDDEVTLKTWILSLRHAGVTFATVVERPDGKTAVSGWVELACVDPSGKPRAFPENLSQHLSTLLPTL